MSRGPHLIAFTRAREESDLWRDGHAQKKNCKDADRAGPERGNAAGEAVRSFYESLVLPNDAGTSSQRKRKVPRRRHPPGQETPRAPNNSEERKARLGNRLLKAAQDGHLPSLRMLVEKEGCDVNYRDGYYWTAVMCAAYAGRGEAVRYLLSHGAAWVGVCETQGQDAMDLAEEAGHQEVVNILQESTRPRMKEESSRLSSTAERKYCAVCQMHYSEDTVATHERSTAHLFSRRDPLPPTRYHIPENNVGFRLMVKGGWNQEGGLGPGGAGRKFPIQTVLKRDQKGLGFGGNLKPKVTHFDAKDPSAVEGPLNPTAKNGTGSDRGKAGGPAQGGQGGRLGTQPPNLHEP
ncbi:hypothetical protein JRQ81_003516 [Phrynocephalus forsythii]|uniref:G-patch domain-containing protein n=1 Tax=Phrynocephalus forsythii TaxID=171643 RepID=A0A9Q1AXI3_9SAUR|nr:hypothetical protein JRQ81_003516 [Phrynocephalus forsythii]